eukprot:549220_1
MSPLTKVYLKALLAVCYFAIFILAMIMSSDEPQTACNLEHNPELTMCIRVYFEIIFWILVITNCLTLAFGCHVACQTKRNKNYPISQSAKKFSRFQLTNDIFGGFALIIWFFVGCMMYFATSDDCRSKDTAKVLLAFVILCAMIGPPYCGAAIMTLRTLESVLEQKAQFATGDYLPASIGP